MKIKYTAASPKNGTEEHVRNDVGLTLIAAGFAQAVPFPQTRGSNEWLAAMKEINADRKPSCHDTVVPNVYPPTWEVELSSRNEVLVVFRSGCQVTRYSSPPKECPKVFAEQYRAAKAANNPGAAAQALASAKIKQSEYDSREQKLW